VPFEYRLPTEGEVTRYGKNSKGQEAIFDESALRILRAVRDDTLRSALVVPSPTGREAEGVEPPTLLRRRLTHFARKRTTDYFLHKNLGAFLQHELEFFIRDQIVHEADLEGDFDAKRRMLRVFRKLADTVITFLAQVEDAQKRLFEKKKFVLRTDYLIPVQCVPRSLWKDVLANVAQLEEWNDLFSLEAKSDPTDSMGPVNEHVLEEHPTLVVDTNHFPPEFSAKLLEAVEDLDDWTDGELIQGKNCSTLSLMLPRYRGIVKCIYIDPPYNKGNDDFDYKDGYQHSTWLAMLRDRLALGRELLMGGGVLFSNIDDVEQPVFRLLMDLELGAANRIANMVFKSATDNNPTRITTEHEYLVWYAKEIGLTDSEWKGTVDEDRDLMLSEWETLRSSYTDLVEIQTRFRKFIKNNRESLEPLTHYDRVDKEGPYTGGRKVHNPGKEGYRHDVIHPKTGKPRVQPARG
jgi:adenine-specific DNA-methyltransferase